MQAIAYTLKNSIKELGLLVFLITISGLIFASFTYFIEIGVGPDSGAIIPSLVTSYYVYIVQASPPSPRVYTGWWSQ